MDIWRGIACLGVVIYHSTLTDLMGRSPDSELTPGASLAGAGMWFANQGWLGVPLFFVLSGYCIAATADSIRGGPSSLWTYFVRRFRRIFPPYWAVLVVSVVVVAVVDYVLVPGLLSSEPRPQLRPWWFSPSQWLGNITLTETWRPYLLGSGRAHFVGQSWTLCYEEQFYAVIGVLLLVCRHQLFLGSFLVTMACVLIQAVAVTFGLEIDGFFFDGSWYLFAAGILVYYMLNYASGRTGRALVLLLFSLPLWPLLLPRIFVDGTIIGLAFACVLWILHPWDSVLTNARILRPLAFCGTICYSLYLIHALVVRIVTKLFYRAGVRGDEMTLLVVLPIALMASLVCGWAFYVAVERRFLNRPKGLPQPVLRPELSGQTG